MAKKEVPWSEIQATSIPETNLKERSKGMTLAMKAMCAFLVLGGIVTPYKMAILFGVLCYLALLMDKSVAVTERGLEIFYDMKFTTNYMKWDWKEISAIAREENPKYPDVYAVYFTKGDRTKRLFFRKDQWQNMIRLAKEGNHGLQVVKNA